MRRYPAAFVAVFFQLAADDRDDSVRVKLACLYPVFLVAPPGLSGPILWPLFRCR
jgi:hypothetical protein